jgi:hypothetical protein
VAPSDDAAVRETLNLLHFSAARALDGMRQIARPPAASRHGAAILLVRRAAIFQCFIHPSSDILFRPPAEMKPAQENDGTF